MLARLTVILAALVAVVATPLLLRTDRDVSEARADARLVIVSPHNQTIRRAFSQAFAAHMRAKRGINVYVDWRVPGGTSEVRRLLDGEFATAAENRHAGTPLDLLFGGSSYDFDRQASDGHLAPSRIFQDQPDLFQAAILPATHTGETYYHPRGLWLGACLSTMGIVANTDTCRRLGLPHPPAQWADLAVPRLSGRVALADPTKSGSVNKAFELIVQEQMQAAIGALAAGEAGYTRDLEAAKASGWLRGIQIIQRIGANSRYFTESAVQIPLDVAQGNAAAGLCIDYYARTYSDLNLRADGSSRLVCTTPPRGTSVSVDGVAILRGAPHRELAEEFVAFVLSKEGQRVWSLRPGQPGAPATALRRLPVRRDLYTPQETAAFADPDARPYDPDATFSYQPGLTGAAFNSLALIIRALCLDSHDELRTAWQALVENGFPPRATAAFEDVSLVGYSSACGNIRRALESPDRLDAVILQRELLVAFRRNYRLATHLARAGL